MNRNLLLVILLCVGLIACKRADFLDKKPSTQIKVPETLTDFQQLMDNSSIMASIGIALPQMAADDYTLSDAAWQALPLATERNSYIWASDIYQGERAENDWNSQYTAVFYANTVLEGLAKSDSAGSTQGLFLKGSALFMRAYAFYELTRCYGKAYDATSANTDLGIPLRLTAAIDYIEPRATLQQSFDQVLKDLNEAENLLPTARPALNLNRPSRIAVYALLARIYLDKRDYVNAEVNADKCLALYDKLTDYRSISKTSATPFTVNNNEELIYVSGGAVSYSELIAAYAAMSSRISDDLIKLYHKDDLRLVTYFARLSDGTYYKKRGYAGSSSLYPFYGLATDEVYLIKAECLARRKKNSEALDKLNQLLIKRFSDPDAYIPVMGSSDTEVLAAVLLERRKELVWRGLRWFDLKRLNKEGAGISLSRTLNGKTYTLAPNEARWVFPIYPAEVAISGIQQNDR
ncbi:RagB/SusD family nutrient uptake outer membrane protein [Pedobacter sp. MC2016-14]|uniref:RagB/SusD family nutrient uptake outer membrane protein n=1 Tax=Pedobacter sp. MC2016-14 TaxID=2897327 RepID=UPI001E3D4233|nr:RagB/SusD family nutrient uptake outer membrane protein [Pedobacter sp. MC2016-14]MCD0488180.1 RagB/SusD family nutrient uptake outer membrane protein [Pedobacter sp. MC2016-14]